MHPRYGEMLGKFVGKLQGFGQPLPGINTESALTTLAMQLVESQRKIERTLRLAKRAPSPDRASPSSDRFDPELAAVLHASEGDLEEAFWLVFLSVHFGRHAHDGWELCRLVYGAAGPDPVWTWDKVKGDSKAFCAWISGVTVGRNAPMPRFGNHRKYESIASPAKGLCAVVSSYVKWIAAYGSHQALIGKTLGDAGGDAKLAFAMLYKGMSAVERFGRLAKFDYLTLISKLQLAPIEADSTYLREATGPKRGASLLFGGSVSSALSADELEDKIKPLAQELGVGMQAMEDALCNWQKSPNKFVAFRG